MESGQPVSYGIAIQFRQDAGCGSLRVNTVKRDGPAWWVRSVTDVWLPSQTSRFRPLKTCIPESVEKVRRLDKLQRVHFIRRRRQEYSRLLLRLGHVEGLVVHRKRLRQMCQCGRDLITVNVSRRYDPNANIYDKFHTIHLKRFTRSLTLFGKRWQQTWPYFVNDYDKCDPHR